MQSGRLVALDGLRGVAAVAVLFHHTLRHIPSPFFVPGYLAVDFFFVLSGLVLARTYERRFDAGLGFFEYVARRFIRLYPSILAGLVLGLAVMLWQGADASIGVIALAQAVMIPQLQGRAFPLNNVQWSLFFELFANILHALLYRWLNKWFLGLIILVSGCALWLRANAHGSMAGGPQLHDYDLGLARVMFSFFVGVALHRLPSLPAIPFPVAAGVLLVILALPTRRFLDPLLGDLLVVTFGWPLLVSASIRGKVRLLAGFADWAGRLSYPLYAIHFPIVAIFEPLIKAEPSNLIRWILAGAAILISILFATIVERFIERPAITASRPKLRPSRPQAAHQP